MSLGSLPSEGTVGPQSVSGFLLGCVNVISSFYMTSCLGHPLYSDTSKSLHQSLWNASRTLSIPYWELNKFPFFIKLACFRYFAVVM
jgi:hypothetical protein